MDIYKQNLFHQTPLRILSFISRHLGEELCAGEIKAAIKTSKGATNQTLKLLLALDIVLKKNKGNLFLYKANPDSYILKYFKILDTLLYIHNLINEIKLYSSEIILYGSCAQGTNTTQSDIDLFVKTEYKSKVSKIINKYRGADDSFKAVILDPMEILSSKKTDEVFYNEVKKGIILWKGKPSYEQI